MKEKEIERALYEVFESFFLDEDSEDKDLESEVIIINPHLIVEQAREILKVKVSLSKVEQIFKKFCKEKGIY